MVIIKLCAFALIAAIIIGLVKYYKPEFTMEITLAVSIMLLIVILESFKTGFEYIESIYGKIAYGKEYLPVIIKIMIICYITEFTSSLCEDAGEKSVADKVRLGGKLCILFAAFPIFESLFTLIETII